MPNTITQLEAFVSSAHYDPDTAAAIAARVPALPSLKGEQLAPGITRIHGNLCNVHGRYGKCPGASVAPLKPKKGKRGRKPKAPKKVAQTPEQKRMARITEHAQNRQKVLNGLGIAPDGQSALGDLADGAQPRDASAIERGGLVAAGLVEQAKDGSYRLSASGRAAMAAAAQGDAGRTGAIISSARDRTTARGERTTAATQRHQAAQTRRETAQAARLAKQQARAAAKKPAKSGGGGKTAAPKTPAHGPSIPSPRRPRHGALPSGSGPSVTSGGAPKPKPSKPITTPVPAKQLAPALTTAAQTLSDGKQLSDSDSMALIRNGLAKLNKDGDLILTAAGQRATMKAYASLPRRPSRPVQTGPRGGVCGADSIAPSFRVFKDAAGRPRWVAQSSTAYQDRDQEIVSTKALADDCQFADAHQAYGPLRWWHTPGLDLGDCDFNAMHGKVLIESGTFRSPQIAQKVAAAADSLEISLGFLHLPSEPDAAGVFHHIRKFERSLVPRGKASNRFTAFRVKERPMFDPTKVAALKTLGFSDADITGLQAQAEATEKAATEQQVAFKADEPIPAQAISTDVMPGERFKAANGDEYIKSPSELDPTGAYYARKAFPPKAADASAPVEGTPEEEAAESPAEEQTEMDAGEGDAQDAGGLTLSPEDLDAIGQAVGAAIQGVASQIMGALDLEKKVAGHVQGLMAPFQAQKDATDAEKTEQIASLKAQQDAIQSKLDELLGLQPAVAPRATTAPATALNPFNPADNALLATIKDQVPADQQMYSNGFEDLAKNLFGR